MRAIGNIGTVTLARPVPRHTFAFIIFLLINVVLEFRPTEILGLDWPLFSVLVLICFAFSFSGSLQQLSRRNLQTQPTVVCALGVLAAYTASLVANGQWESFSADYLEFLGAILYLVLFLVVIDTRARLRRFLVWSLVSIWMLALLVLSQYHGILNSETIHGGLTYKTVDVVNGGSVMLKRLQGIGIYNDPNDFCLVLQLGLLIAFYLMRTCRRWYSKLLLAPVASTFLYGVILTQSRGGFLALVCALGVLAVGRFGWRKTVLVSVPLLLLLALLVPTRSTIPNILDKEDSVQTRIRLWADGLMEARDAPLFGMGPHRFMEENGEVVHNSFLQGFCELGLFGGAMFLGLLYVPLLGIGRFRRRNKTALDPSLLLMGGYIAAILVGYAVGITSLTRTYTSTSYLMAGMGAAYLGIVRRETGQVPVEWNLGLLARLVGTGVGLLYCFHFVVRALF